MVKATDPGMDTHLALDLTQLASAWLVTRLDNTQFRFTTNTRDVDIDIGDGNGVQTYSANEGYTRTNIAADSELSVSNLDIGGVFDNAQLDETELRRGLFDFADVKIFFFNWDDISDGIIKILRGTFGEIIVTDQGLFKTTLRDLTTVFSRRLGEKVSKDCRDDLGGPFCLVPTFPDPLALSTAYAVGDFVRIPTVVDNDACAFIQMNYEGTDGATSGPGFVNQGTHIDPTTNGTPEVDTAQTPAGGDSTSSMLFDGSTDYFSWPDAALLQFLAGEVTIHGHFRVDTVGIDQVIASKWDDTGDNREWFLRVDSGNVLRFEVHDDGLTTPDVSLVGGTTIVIDTDYHVAVVRKSNGDWEMFLAGVSEAGPTTPTGDVFDGTAELRIGSIRVAAANTQFFSGHIDSFEIVNFAKWEAGFTPPTGNLSNVSTAISTLLWIDFNDTMYEVTTAGTSGICFNTPDETKGNTHSQGTVVLTARHAWSRAITVTAIGSDARRDFTVTELTPNSGHAPGAGPYPETLGFADDFFNGGLVVWETGNNSGIGPKSNKEIRGFVADDGATITQDIELFERMPFDIVVGDTARIITGCDKVFQTCIEKFNNPRRFKGEPFVPGADILGQYPDAPSG